MCITWPLYYETTEFQHNELPCKIADQAQLEDSGYWRRQPMVLNELLREDETNVLCRRTETRDCSQPRVRNQRQYASLCRQCLDDYTRHYFHFVEVQLNRL